jgi:hypothetical protein
LVGDSSPLWFARRDKRVNVIPVPTRSVFVLRQLQATEDFYIRVMTDIEAKLNCEWHIADLKLRLAQLKKGSRLGSHGLASSEFVELLQQTLNSWEERKKTLAEHH